jgi:hypothetical protein
VVSLSGPSGPLAEGEQERTSTPSLDLSPPGGEAIDLNEED